MDLSTITDPKTVDQLLQSTTTPLNVLPGGVATWIGSHNYTLVDICEPEKNVQYVGAINIQFVDGEHFRDSFITHFAGRREIRVIFRAASRSQAANAIKALIPLANNGQNGGRIIKTMVIIRDYSNKNKTDLF